MSTQVDTYNAVGNRTLRNLNNVLTTWTYDNAYRLLGQQTAGAYATFTYDTVGNTTTKWQSGTSPMTFVYDAANRITTMQQGAVRTTYTYDNNGNPTLENAASALTTNSYDAANRLTGVVPSAGTRSTYTYRGDNKRRTAQEAGAALSTMIWDGEEYLGEY